MDRTDACALAAYALALHRLASSVEHYGHSRGERDSDMPKMREYVDAIVKIVAPTSLDPAEPPYCDPPPFIAT